MAHHLHLHRLPHHSLPLLRLLVSRKGRNSASSLFSAALSLSPNPHPSLFTSLMHAIPKPAWPPTPSSASGNAASTGLALSLSMLALLLHDTMIDSRKLNYAKEDAWAFYLEVVDAGFPPSVLVFNRMMHCFVKEGKVKQARFVFDRILRAGSKPNAVNFNTMINGYCRIGDLDAAFGLKEEMLDSGVRPDVFTYSVLIKGLCKVGRLEDADKVFDEMCTRGI